MKAQELPGVAWRARLVLGAGLALVPLLVQVPFNVLVATFDYPDILRQPAGEILVRFAAGGHGLLWTWYAYALCLVPFLLIVIALPDVLEMPVGRRALVRALGTISAVTQLVGLLRWTLVVPALAAAYTEPLASEATRNAVAVAFDLQHRLFGNLLGEHLGQMTLALWTFLVAGHETNRVLRTLGRLGAGLFLLGLADGLLTVVPLPGSALIAEVPLVAFLIWTVWLVATGVRVMRAAWRAR